MGIRFTDVAAKAGLKEKTVAGGEQSKKYILETTTGGVAFLDYDGDGWLDLFFVNGTHLEPPPGKPKPSNRLYHNERDGTFQDVTRQAGLEHSGWGQGVCAGDYDNDGATDLFVTYWGQNVLYRNGGNGRFVDVTAKAGLKSGRTRWGSGCAFFDYDRDGRLDLFVSNYVDFDITTASLPGTNPLCQFRGLNVNCGPRGLRGESNLLYRNNGDGSFVDLTEASGIGKARGNFGLGVLTGDFDNDGWPDVYVANDTNASLLFHNQHDGTFTEIGAFAGCAYDADGSETSGMGVTAADYNRDGWLDIFKTNFSDESASLYRNSGDGFFTEVASQAGISRNQKWLGWGAGFLDADNDGWPDIFLVNGHVYPEVDRPEVGLSYRQPKVLYRNREGRDFEDVSEALGAPLTTPAVARGCAFGDFDNDGDIDIAINNMHDSPSLLRLDSAHNRHWLQVELSGVKSNRGGIGARVLLAAGDMRQIDEVRSGGSYLSQNAFRLHFGLDALSRVDRLEVQWPSGVIDRIENVAADQIIHIREAEGLTQGTTSGVRP
jgi:hypothetical protein